MPLKVIKSKYILIAVPDGNSDASAGLQFLYATTPSIAAERLLVSAGLSLPDWEDPGEVFNAVQSCAALVRASSIDNASDVAVLPAEYVHPAIGKIKLAEVFDTEACKPYLDSALAYMASAGLNGLSVVCGHQVENGVVVPFNDREVVAQLVALGLISEED